MLDVTDSVVEMCVPAIRRDRPELGMHEQTRCEWIDLVLLHALDQSVPVDTLVCNCAVASWQDTFVEPVHGEGRLVGLAHCLLDDHLQAVYCM